MKKIKKRLNVVLVGLIAFAIAMVVDKIFTLSNDVTLIMFLVVYMIVGSDVIKSAIHNILRGQVFDEQFLMTLATVCAFLVGAYPEGAAVMLFYQIGELFQSYAVYNSRKSISELMDIRPDYANVIRNGEIEKVSPDDVHIDDIIVVKPGEKIPLDGIVTEGNSALDTKALTGESIPKDIKSGDEILSGCINLTGNLSIKVTKIFGESTVSKILDLVENAGSKKAKTENFITRFARYYTPVVVMCAVALALVPSFILGFDHFSTWVYRAMVFLVVSCPCALVISVPLSFFGGLGASSKQGVLVKGSNYLEVVSKIDTVVFDKTGTLTKGTFNVTQIDVAKNVVNFDQEELLKYAACAEFYSNHPIAISLRKAYGKAIVDSQISSVEEIQGHGILANVESKQVLAGNAKLMKKYKIEFAEANQIGTVVYIAIDGKFAGYIVIADEIKADTVNAIALLRKAGIKNVVMLTGDNKEIAEKIASEIGITKVYSELLPQDKVQKLELIMSESQTGTVFVGDGVNDAPVLARADVGIAMGGMGSDAAIEAADIVIMTDEISKIATVIKISKKTLNIAKQNIVFALGVKLIVLILGALGIASMWLAVFADVGVSFIAIINSMRAMKHR
ncbi:heavy metal translocating P-type ATPase [[Clostridium] fimetarium]|uniref:Cd2+/Zn2+-exporting ATPase n=1 Tax=[Clostridium] fimetarium TaxID=99656 RepID=A0A1I0R262_9FIRM|nr:heavy metal translocating P-type ATPase [[Clostridium] fimetarium]SEW34360.1 Cd2+/Zn2+-exporting ATPase [[Clostridium] fimetarium]